MELPMWAPAIPELAAHLGGHRGPRAADRHPVPAAQRHRPGHLDLAAPGRGRARRRPGRRSPGGPASAWTPPRSRRSWPAWSSRAGAAEPGAAGRPALARGRPAPVAAPGPGGGWVGCAAVSDRDDLLQMIKDKAVVHGDFVLSSGQRATWYIDLRRVLLSGQAAPLAGRVMLDLTAGLGLRRGRRPHPGRRPGGHRDDARRQRGRAAAGRVRGAQRRQGARPAAAYRGPGRRRAPGARRGGHLDHRRRPC